MARAPINPRTYWEADIALRLIRDFPKQVLWFNFGTGAIFFTLMLGLVRQPTEAANDAHH